MAIYHFSVKAISRADGRSVVAAAAYRSGEKLIDQRQGKEQDYTRKTGVEFTKIYAPDNTHPELLDRNQLWNTVEKVERRKDANLAREFEIAFPHELNIEQRQAMLDDLCQQLVKRHGVIVDAAIHAPHTQSGSDERNYHAHILFTGRQIDPETGYFAKIRNRDFNREHSSQTVSQWRERFADIANQHLARAGYLSIIDHRSYADQDNGLQATQHEGSKVTQLRRQGIETEISLKNDLIKQQNAEKQRVSEVLNGLDQEILATAQLVAKLQQEQRQQNPNSHALAQIHHNLDQADHHLAQIPAIDTDRLNSNAEHLRQAFALGVQQRQQGNAEANTAESKPEAAKKPSPQEIFTRANQLISHYEAILDTLEKEIRHSLYQAEKSEYDGKQRKIAHDLKQVQQKIDALGQRPIFFTKKWDSACAELHADQDRLKKYRNNLSEPRVKDCSRLAKQQMNIQHPELQEKYEKAVQYKKMYLRRIRLEAMTPDERIQEFKRDLVYMSRTQRTKAEYVIESITDKYKDHPQQLQIILDQTKLKIMKDYRVLDQVVVPEQKRSELEKNLSSSRSPRMGR